MLKRYATEKECILFCSIVSVVGRAAAIQDALFLYSLDKYVIQAAFVLSEKKFFMRGRYIILKRI